jgi:hypothetical protein
VVQAAKLVHNADGSYRFIPVEGAPFSGGAVADSGYDMVHARLARPLPLEQGLSAAASEVGRAGRPVLALAGFELRIPAPLTRQGFNAFNEGYVSRLRAMGLQAGGLMPAARTNVAVVSPDVTEPSLHAFTYTTPRAARGHRKVFVVSGIPEDEPGDTATMLDSIMRAMAGRMAELEVGWNDATEVQIYGVEITPAAIEDRVLKRAGRAAVLGIHWFPSLPPIDSLILEVDVRGAGTELVVE